MRQPAHIGAFSQQEWEVENSSRSLVVTLKVPRRPIQVTSEDTPILTSVRLQPNEHETCSSTPDRSRTTDRSQSQPHSLRANMSETSPLSEIKVEGKKGVGDEYVA